MKGSNQTSHFTKWENGHAPPSKHQERANNLSILTVFGPDKFSCGLVKGSNQTSHSTNKKTAMHHHTENEERAFNLSILAVSGTAGFVRVESKEAAGCVSLSLSLLCVTVVVIVVVVSVCAVWCGDTLKKPRVYVQNVSVCTGNRSTYVNTCGCGDGTHGDVLNGHTGRREVIVSSAYQNLPTKGYHVPQRFNKETHPNTQSNSRHTTQRHTATLHRTRHSKEAKRREEEMKYTKRDRDEKRYKFEKRRGKENREKLKESWSSTKPARILQSFALLKACHAQPLSRSR